MQRHSTLLSDLERELGTKLSQLTQIRDRVVRADLKTPTELKEVALDLRGLLGLNHCVLMSAVDYIDSFECVYHLADTDTGEMLELRVYVDHEDPKLDSLVEVWEGIDWHEREAFDLLGIVFEGHPDLRRILLPANWEGHPLRKDYIYPIHEEQW